MHPPPTLDKIERENIRKGIFKNKKYYQNLPGSSNQVKQKTTFAIK